MATGTIKKVMAEKGFGFLQIDGEDVFFHRSEVKNAQFDELREGQKVECSVIKDVKGKKAQNVMLRP